MGTLQQAPSFRQHLTPTKKTSQTIKMRFLFAIFLLACAVAAANAECKDRKRAPCGRLLKKGFCTATGHKGRWARRACRLTCDNCKESETPEEDEEPIPDNEAEQEVARELCTVKNEGKAFNTTCLQCMNLESGWCYKDIREPEIAKAECAKRGADGLWCGDVFAERTAE